MKKYSLSDLPLEQNVKDFDFGQEGYVQGLERFISHAATPITIALQGEWGSGKTSLMNCLYLDMCSDSEDFIGININTWEFSMLATPEETVIKIIGELINSLTEKESGLNSKARQYFQGFVNAAYRFGREVAKGANVPFAGPIIEALGLPTEFSASGTEGSVASISKLKEILTKSIQEILDKTGKKGILIFVDDLDRLNPPLAVQILELLKNIFTINNCIFILAIDYDVVVKGLEPKFGKFSETNEREFRSFFDKIIQVPFSLPVNNYKPMKFVLDSLESIGYITKGEQANNYVQKNFKLIVDSSVGKNPRSIKRLINTLSLLDCIGQCTRQDEANDDSIESKITSFAIVALQVCYPKIYDILRYNPVYANWNASTASKFNLNFDKEQSEDVDGNAILDAVCSKDVYLNTHKNDIHSLLDLIHKTASVIDDEKPGEVIQKILDRSSITNVSVTVEAEKFDAKEFQLKLRDNVWKYIESKAPEVKWHRWKRNNGTSGGIVIELPDGSVFDVVFEPKLLESKSNAESGNTIALKVWLNIMHNRTERLQGLDFSAIMADDEVSLMIAPLNEAVARYVSNETIESTTFGGHKFKNLADELAFRGKDNGLRDYITPNTQYWINHKSASNFEEKTTIAAIGDLIIGAYELNRRALSLQ